MEHVKSGMRTWALWLGVAVVSLAPGLASAEEAEEEAAPPAPAVSGYFRVDTDRFGTQIWFGAEHRVGGVRLASDVFLVNSTAEIDVGPAFSIGPYLSVSPMGGLVVDLNTTDLNGVAPQFYVYCTAGRWYLESWETALIVTSSRYHQNSPHTFSDRTFLLYSLCDQVAVGPHAEMQAALEDPQAHGGGSRLQNLILGGAAQVAYGENNTLLLFGGYETREGARAGGNGVAGRATFIRVW